MTTRLSVNVNDETAEALRELAADHETSVTEIVRRVSGFYKFIHDEDEKGRHLHIVTRRGRRTRVFIL